MREVPAFSIPGYPVVIAVCGVPAKINLIFFRIFAMAVEALIVVALRTVKLVRVCHESSSFFRDIPVYGEMIVPKKLAGSQLSLDFNNY
jgi:hypothetical protein